MEYRVHLNLLSTAAVVVLGVGVSLVTSTAVASRAYRQRGVQAATREQAITVKGAARQTITSDLAVWQIRVQGEGQQLPEAYSVLEAAAQRVRTFLTEKGYRPGEIGLAAIGTETIFQRDKDGEETNVVDRYRLQRTFTITTPDVERVHQTAGEVTQLIEAGVFVVSLPPEYYYSKVAELKIASMGLASKDARARADEIARNAGCLVTDVRQAHMGVLQITRPNSTQVSDYGIYDTTTIEKDVQAVVTLTLGIQSGK